MIDEADLQAAVADGIIDRAQAVRIAHLARLRRESAAGGSDVPESGAIDPDDERFRLIGGFNDVFVAIGVCLLAGALLGLAQVLGLGNAFAVMAALAAWGLSEIFARRMRLALPSILLAGMFAASVAIALGLLGGGTDRTEPFSAVGITASAGFALAALLHHWRFRVPIDVALVTCGVLAVLLAALFSALPSLARDALNPILVASGLAVFAFAVSIDMSDPDRRTRRSDSAFWLHLLAAGLIVHPIFRGMLWTGGGFGTVKALIILAVFVVLGLVALVIDRRALLVSALSYAGVAVAYLISQNVSADLSLPLALLGLAVLVLALSAGWRTLRGALLPRLPLGRLRARLPPVEAKPI